MRRLEVAAPLYAGADRRGLVPRRRPPWPIIGLTAVATVVVALVLLADDTPRWTAPVQGALAAATVTAGVIACAIAAVHVRTTRSLMALWLAAGLAAMTVLDHLATALITVVGPSTEVTTGAPGAARLTLLLVTIAALLLPEVDKRQRPLLVVSISCGIAVVAIAVLHVLGDRTDIVVGVPGGGRALAGTGALAWLLLGCVAALRARRQLRLLTAWIAPAALAWALAGLVRVLRTDVGVEPVALVLDLIALAMVIIGLLAELDVTRQQHEQRQREADALARLAHDRDRLHDVRNALVAIGGVAHILGGDVPTERRRELSGGVKQELERIRALVGAIAEPDLELPDRRSDPGAP